MRPRRSGRRLTIARAPRPAAENSLGLAGFILSVVGIISCGLLCPIGAILSLFGCRREPNGLAIAGLVIGIVGSLGLIIVFIFFGMALMAFFGMALGLGVYAEVEQDSVAIQSAIKEYVRQNGTVPSTLQQLPGLTADHVTDPWGNAYIYRPDASGGAYTVESCGPDGNAGTNDDFDIR